MDGKRKTGRVWLRRSSTQSGGCVQEGQIIGDMGAKKWKNCKIHVNSNGMCGVCLGEIYNLILDALCEH